MTGRPLSNTCLRYTISTFGGSLRRQSENTGLNRSVGSKPGCPTCLGWGPGTSAKAVRDLIGTDERFNRRGQQTEDSL